MQKDEYPLAIADYLGIPSQEGRGGPWMSTEGTVLRDWVLSVGEALDVPYTTKVATMAAMVHAVGQVWDSSTMASEATESGGGGNISAPAFQALLKGLQEQPAARRRQRLSGPSTDFDPPVPAKDQDERALRAIRVRRGQPKFRAELLRAYAGRCAFTGTDAVATLEAAHIDPYGNGGSYAVTNGILLRSDIHTLFDLYLITVDAHTSMILLHPELADTTYGQELGGRTAAFPVRYSDRPSRDALLAHRHRCDL